MAGPDFAALLNDYHLQAAPLVGPALDASIAEIARTARTRSARLGVP